MQTGMIRCVIRSVREEVSKFSGCVICYPIIYTTISANTSLYSI